MGQKGFGHMIKCAMNLQGKDKEGGREPIAGPILWLFFFFFQSFEEKTTPYIYIYIYIDGITLLWELVIWMRKLQKQKIPQEKDNNTTVTKFLLRWKKFFFPCMMISYIH